MSPDFRPFFQRISASSLDFRAAANSTVDSSRRPIKERVLWRICNAAEFKNIFDSLFPESVAAALPNTSTSLAQVLDGLLNPTRNEEQIQRVMAEFFRRLNADQRFATLTLEAIEQDKRWTDLVNGPFQSWAELLRSVVEKVFDKTHPASRITATIALCGISLFGSYSLVASIGRPVLKDINVPIQIDPLPPTHSVPITFGLPGPTPNIPIKITPDPVDVNFKGFGDSSPLLAEILVELGRLREQVGNGQDRPTRADGVLARVYSDVTDLKTQLPALGARVATLETSVPNIDQREKATDQHVQTLQGDLITEMSVRGVLEQSVFKTQASTSMVVPENRNATAFVKWIENGPNHTNASCNVTATVKIKRGGVYHVTLNLANQKKPGCNPAPIATTDQIWGKGIDLLANQPYLVPEIHSHIAIVAAEHHWFFLGRSKAELLFEPD